MEDSTPASKGEIRTRIEEIGIIPAIRLSSAPDALFAAEAVADSGIPIMEVTMTVPGAVGVIEELVRNNGEDVPLIASGGVNQHTAAEFILAGAVALGIGRDLIQPSAIERRERNWISELSRRFLRIVKEARAQMQAG